MLRHVVLDNFIHFQGHQTLHFKPGCNLFIGENGSGKTSVFEAVRRCTGLSRNASFSRPHFQNKVSATSCIFAIEGRRSVSDESDECPMLFSSLIRLPSDCLNPGELRVKVAFNSSTDAIGVDLVREIQETGILVNSEVHLQDENKIKQIIWGCLQSVTENTNSATVFQALFSEIEECVIKSIDSFMHEHTDKVTETRCEELLKEYIDGKTVFTFSVRGFGVCQWSLSERVKHEYKHDNYLGVQKRAEILKWFFLSVKQGAINEEEQNNVKRYFNIITDYCGFEFHIDDIKEEIHCSIKIPGKRKAYEDDTKDIQKRLSKVPEGFIEAMHNAIILGVSCFRSVFLEEPEKGMHPQMIVRMRDLLLRKMSSCQKTVVISSHHPSFLAPWTIPRLSIFKQSENESGVAFRVIHGDQIATFHNDKKLSRVITSDRFSSLFYANRIFFVEGDSDEFFLTELRLLLIDSDDEEILQLLQPPSTGNATAATPALEIDPVSFRAFMSSIQILNMSGETYKERMFKLCQELEIDTMFLHDFDVLRSREGSKVQQFLKSFNLQDKYPNETDILKNVAILEDDGFCIWDECKLESVVKGLADRHSSLKKCLEDNHCERVANYVSGKKNKSRNKLFLDDKVTDSNIENVVRAIIACCKKDILHDIPTEMIRLIRFLRKCSLKAKKSVHIQTII